MHLTFHVTNVFLTFLFFTLLQLCLIRSCFFSFQLHTALSQKKNNNNKISHFFLRNFFGKITNWSLTYSVITDHDKKFQLGYFGLFFKIWASNVAAGWLILPEGPN